MIAQMNTSFSINVPVLSLIIPTFNEGKNIPELIERIESTLESISFEIIVIDDNSPDGTANIAENLNQKYGNIRVCRREGKLGLSSAVLCGFSQANGDILAVIDADMQHPPEILPKLFDAISSGYDLVVASRYVQGGGIENWKFKRKLYSKCAILLAHALLPTTRKVKDIMSGCFMIKKEYLCGITLNPIGFKILLEIISKVKIDSVLEVPFVFTNRVNGRSNLSDTEIKNYVVHLFRLFWYSRMKLHKE